VSLARVTTVLSVLAVQLTGLLGIGTSSAQVGDGATPGSIAGDFNGDGFVDFAVGVPQKDPGSIRNAGIVSVIYGSAAGLQASTPPDQVWSQDSPGIQNFAERGDRFGAAVAVGDFNGDGFGDLAAGVPNEDRGTADTGGVNVIYGSPGGLDASSVPNQFWSMDQSGVLGSASTGAQFGRSLASGDFNGDGVSDLAVGSPGNTVAGIPGAGNVNILYGSSTGLVVAGNQFWAQHTTGVEGTGRSGDQFARSLSSGDFGNGIQQDLAIGNPFDDEAAPDAGSVNVLYGSVEGLAVTGNQLWTQDSPGIPGTSEDTDIFGWDVAAADFGASSEADLAIGVPLESKAGISSGAVDVIYGTAGGLDGTGAQVWTQDSPGVPGEATADQAFGASVAADDFGNSSRADLAIGVAADTVDNLSGAGSVNVLYGSAPGLTATGSQLWSQNSTGIVGTAEPGDLFGADVGTADFDGDGHADLAVGVTYEDVGNITDAGSANVIYADAGGAGLTDVNNQIWSQNSPGILGKSNPGDQFTFAVA
jgi:hypothetical protein